MRNLSLLTVVAFVPCLVRSIAPKYHTVGQVVWDIHTVVEVNAKRARGIFHSVWNHQPRDCLLNCLFRRRSKKTSMLRVTGLCGGSSPGTGEFPAQMASNAENVSIWWRHQACKHIFLTCILRSFKRLNLKDHTCMYISKSTQWVNMQRIYIWEACEIW